MSIDNQNGIKIIDKKGLKGVVPYSPQHIARLEKAGQFPRRVKLGANRVGWFEHEVVAWLRDRPRA
ncbi:MAG: AlpA family phage regulatory protein [Bauldia sp.]|nr:AlpA family phage regulatory protein [Bauldia sp.]